MKSSSIYSERPKPGYRIGNFAASMLFQTLPTKPSSTKKSGVMEAFEAELLKSIEEKNGRIRKLLAEAMLYKEALKMALDRKF